MIIEGQIIYTTMIPTQSCCLLVSAQMCMIIISNNTDERAIVSTCDASHSTLKAPVHYTHQAMWYHSMNPQVTLFIHGTSVVPQTYIVE